MTSFCADASGLDPALETVALETLAGARDLHMEPYGYLAPCAGADLTSTNRNALSVALSLDSI